MPSRVNQSSIALVQCRPLIIFSSMWTDGAIHVGHLWRSGWVSANEGGGSEDIASGGFGRGVVLSGSQDAELWSADMVGVSGMGLLLGGGDRVGIWLAEELPNLTSIYGALNNDVQSQMQTYGDKDFVAPLEDDLLPSFHKHQVPEGVEGRSTVSSSWFVFQCIANRSWSQSCPVQEWLQYQQEFVDESIHLDGLGEQGQLVACVHYGENDGTVRCEDCCTNCIVASHVFLLLHWLSVNFFVVFSSSWL